MPTAMPMNHQLAVFLWMSLIGCVVASPAQDALEPPWESWLQREKASVRAMRGWASNIQFHRDSGRVRFVRFSRPHVTNQHLAPLAACTELRYLAVVTPQVSDEGLAHAAPLRQLESLLLSDSGMGDATLPWIAKQTQLTELYLDRTAVTDRGLAVLDRLQGLETLSLAGVAVGPTTLQSAAKLPSLQRLSLARTPCDDEDLQVFAQPNKWLALQSLTLDGLSFEGRGLAALSNLPKLQRLSLVDCRLSAASVQHLAPLQQLKQLVLWQADAPAEAVASLRDALPDTQIFFEPRESLWRRWRAEQRVASEPAASVTQPQGPAPRSPQDVDKAGDVVFWDADQGPDFQRHVLPLLGRLGCNGRSCHGSFQGRGGFQLSMFGYDFAADLQAMAGGEHPRVNVRSPAESLLLYKPTHGDEHGGGQRLQPKSWQHRLLLEWIRRGASGVDQPRQLSHLEVRPSELVFPKAKASSDNVEFRKPQAGRETQLQCIAVWADGRREDVTRLARFQSNDEAVAQVDSDGRITVVGPGETHIIAFYDKGVAATQVLLPRSNNEAASGSAEAHEPWERTAARGAASSTTKIDQMVQAKLDKLGIEPSPRCDDAAFLRRISLDIAGTLPTPAQVRSFVADDSADKRSRVIDDLLASPAHATWLAMWLSDLTGSNAQYLGTTDMNRPAADQWNDWLRRRVEENAGWDDIAAGILLATSREPGETYQQYAARQSSYRRRPSRDAQPADFAAPGQPMHYYWFRSNNQQPADRALSFGYIFLGVRLQCAQCHKHPFDRWSQQDFEQFSNFFRRIKIGAAPDAVEPQRLLKSQLGVPQRLNTAALRRQMYLRVSAEGLPIPWNEVWIEPPAGVGRTARVLGGESIELDQLADPREPLVAWLLSPENPYFARAMVNRIWRRYLGVGIVDPADDLNRANPPSNAALLDWLSEQFIQRDYDLRWLQRTICNTAAYQRQWRPNDSNREDQRNFARAALRRLPAEVAIDAILQATASDSLNDAWIDRVDGRKISQQPKSIQARGIDYSLLIFGKPLRTTNCDCQRQDQPTLLQSLYVRNDTELLAMLERPDGWLQQLSKSWGLPLATEATASSKAAKAQSEKEVVLSHEAVRDAVEQAYLRTLCRPPNTEELAQGVEHVRSLENPLEGLRDLLWALINTQEFLLNH